MVEAKLRYPVMRWRSRREREFCVIAECTIASGFRSLLVGNQITIRMVSTSILAKLAMHPSSLFESLIESPSCLHKLANIVVYFSEFASAGKSKKKSSK